MNRQARILIVDDNRDALVILGHLLTTAGYSITTALGGADALRKIEKQTFDLVLTDLSMPDVSGVDIIDRIKSDPKLQSTPTIAITAYVWDSISQCAGDSGCDGFVQKPLDKKKLLHEIEKWLHNSSDSRHARP